MPKPSEDLWHALHNFRVQRTFDFLNWPTLVPLLASVLQAQMPANIVMSWLVKHCGLKAEEDRLKFVADFVRPSSSPYYKALAMGANLLRDRTLWYAAFVFHPNSFPAAVIQMIWTSMLPALAILQLRLGELVEGFPLQLAMLNMLMSEGDSAGWAHLVA